MIPRGEACYKSLFENSLVPMMFVDLGSQTVVEANPAASELYGYSREEFEGMPVSQFETMSPDMLRALMARQIKDPSEKGRTLRHRTADGSIREVDARVGVVSEPPSRIAHMIITDVTDREAAFRELDAHRQRLEQLLQERTEALGAAHEELSRRE